MRRFAASWAFLVAAALAGPGAPAGASAAPRVVSATQTVRVTPRDDGGVRGRQVASYTALGLRSRDWDLRASLSWLHWRDDGGALALPGDSGFGSAYLSAGRRIWTTRADGASATAWLRLKGKIPLQTDFGVTGSGAFDWGGSLFTTFRLGRATLLTEIGRLHLGGPSGYGEDGMTSVSSFLSYARPGARLYPLAGYGRASSLAPGEPPYGEWSLGLGSVVSPDVSLTALYAASTTGGGQHGSVAVSVWLRL